MNANRSMNTAEKKYFSYFVFSVIFEWMNEWSGVEWRRECNCSAVCLLTNAMRMKQVYIFWHWSVLQIRLWLCAWARAQATPEAMCECRAFVCMDRLLSANNDLANQGNVHLYMTNFCCGNECVIGIRKKMELYGKEHCSHAPCYLPSSSSSPYYQPFHSSYFFPLLSLARSLPCSNAPGMHGHPLLKWVIFGIFIFVSWYFLLAIPTV